MKIVQIEKYGAPEVLHIVEVPKPEIKENEILVKVKSVAVTAADARIRAARFPKGFGYLARLIFGVFKPRIKVLGGTYSGVVAAVGKQVTEFHAGDEVCGMTGVSMGTYAEYIVIKSLQHIVRKPQHVTHEQAAGVLFGGTAALYFVRDLTQVSSGEKVLVNGASGAVGTNAVQLATYYGAEVNGVTSAKNASLVKRLGATQVIDYSHQDISELKEKYDVVLDTVGNVSPNLSKVLLTPRGRMGLIVASLGEMLTAKGPVKVGTASENKEDIEFLLSLVDQGKLDVVIDHVYPLSEVVTAHQQVDSGHKVGNIILNLY